MRKTERDFSRFKNDLIELMGEHGPGPADSEVYSDMLYNIGLLRQENLDLSELRLLNTAFKELRYALKVFKPYRAIPKAAVFGSARTPKNHPAFKMAREFGKKIVKKGWMIITGGASGIMEAAMIGAGAQNSFGLNILLPFEQNANAVIMGNQKLIFFKYFFTRKLMFLKESQATVLFPGGFGTFDEGFESFTLVQTGKAKPRPIVLVDTPGSRFWSGAIHFFDSHMRKEGWISPNDLSLLRHFHDPQEAVDDVAGFYANYDSSRFLKDRYLVRVRKPISAAALETINTRFKDILSGGRFERLDDVTEDDNKDLSLHRIVFRFDRSSYARLRQLVDHVNTL